MKAIIINGQSKELEETEVGREMELAALIGQDTIVSDGIDPRNAVYFDEDCFIRGTEGRFQIDSLPPIAGKAVVIGVIDGALTDTSLDVESLRERIHFS